MLPLFWAPHVTLIVLSIIVCNTGHHHYCRKKMHHLCVHKDHEVTTWPCMLIQTFPAFVSLFDWYDWGYYMWRHGHQMAAISWLSDEALLWLLRVWLTGRQSVELKQYKNQIGTSNMAIHWSFTGSDHE